MEVVSRLVTVREPTHVAHARRSAAEIAHDLGFDEVMNGRVAIGVTEAATNLIKHAGGGELYLGAAGAHRVAGLQMVAMDRGGGIRNMTASLRDGYSTTGTAGTGLGAIRRAATTFDVYSDSGGTIVAATFFPGGREPLALGAINAPAPGEDKSGDAWAAWSAGELTSIFVCDGLGHGIDAAAAAQAAVETFRRHAERSAREVITAVHDALRATRGGAVALAEIDQRAGTLRYCGLGNIGATIIDPDAREQHLVSVSGIAGHVMRRLQEFTYPCPPGSTLVMQSDGIGTHWALQKYPGLIVRRPDVIAGVIFRDHKRGRDDATVVVCGCGGSA
jgi:anti-sigma regulatory factor (Ser/Thr protein kinase)